MKTYKHSETFAHIKAIKEDISINLTSLQYLQMLDYYLWRALELLIKISKQFFIEFFAKVVAYQQVHIMTKVSSAGRQSLSCAFYNFVCNGDIQALKKEGLNRSLYLGIISYWLSLSKKYFDSQSCFNLGKKLDSPEKLCVSNKKKYFAVYKEIDYWMSLALDFKSKIMQKYTRMTLLQAQRAYVEFGYKLDLDDVTQIYLQTMSKAIDRCDSRLGVLTTFIQSWLKSAYASVQDIVNSGNVTDSIDAILEETGDDASLGTIENESTYDAMQHIAYEASKIDPTGCLRIKYNIPQFLTQSDINIIKEHYERLRTSKKARAIGI